MLGLEGMQIRVTKIIKKSKRLQLPGEIRETGINYFAGVGAVEYTDCFSAAG